MRVSLVEMNGLRDLDRHQLASVAAEVGLPKPIGQYPTNDSLRLAILDAMVSGALEQGAEVIEAASKVGAEHFSIAVSTHAHAVELSAESERLDGEGKHAEAVAPATRAERHFAVARSAAAVAQCGLIAAALGAVGDVLGEMGS